MGKLELSALLRRAITSQFLELFGPCPLASGTTWNVKIIESPLRMVHRDVDYQEETPHFTFMTHISFYIFNNQ